MQPPNWKGLADSVPMRHEWTEQEGAVVRASIIRSQAFSLLECETPDLQAWKIAPPTSEPAWHGEGGVSPSTIEKPRRKMGDDVIVIAADFNAPLSPEEEELFGL
jgi:hypothetical protein